MKNLIESYKNQSLLAFFLLFNAVVSFAQEGGGTTEGDASVSVSKTTTKSTSSTTMTDWYTQPWVWVVGGLVFILILVALVRGGSSRTEVKRTTVHRDV